MSEPRPSPVETPVALRRMLEAMIERGQRPRTVAAYRAAVLAFYAAFPDHPPDQLGPPQAGAWLRARQARGLRTEQAASALGRLFGCPFPMASRRPPRPRPLRPAEDIARLLAALPRAFSMSAPRVAILLLATTGIRLAELTALRVGDLDLSARRLRVDRGGVRQDRLLPIPPELLDSLLALNRRRPLSAPLLAGRYGKAITSRTVQRWLVQASRCAGLSRPLSAVDLRQAWVAERASQGVDATRLQRLAGHGRPASTRRLLRRLSPYS